MSKTLELSDLYERIKKIGDFKRSYPHAMTKDVAEQVITKTREILASEHRLINIRNSDTIKAGARRKRPRRGITKLP